MIAQNFIVAHVHLLHLVWAHALIGQVAKKLISLLTILPHKPCEGKRPNIESDLSVAMVNQTA